MYTAVHVFSLQSSADGLTLDTWGRAGGRTSRVICSGRLCLLMLLLLLFSY